MAIRFEKYQRGMLIWNIYNMSQQIWLFGQNLGSKKLIDPSFEIKTLPS